MPSNFHLLFLVAGTFFPSQGPLGPPGNDGDVQILREANVGTEGPALIQFFRSRVVTEANRARVLALVKQLGDNEFGTRERAGTELVALGPIVEPFLKQALSDPDPEIQRRAEQCLQSLSLSAGSRLIGAAARLLAARRPAGAAEVLLAYAPQASEESVVEAIHSALGSVARADEKPDPVVIAALTDPSGARRLAAAMALVKAAARDQQPAIRKLLRDPEPRVRLGVALALARAQDRAAVPVLIDLVGELPADQIWRAEEILITLAGEEVSNLFAGPEKRDPGKKREAWLAWWRAKGDKVDLALLSKAPLFLGFTLVVLQDNTALKGRVLELDREGKTRWQIEDLRRPVDAQVLPGDRVLIAESPTRSVTERNLKGEILWQHQAAGILVGAQRLPNGNTFIVCRDQLYEVNRAGQSVLTFPRPRLSNIMGARKLANGEIVMLTSPGTWVRLDASGKEIASSPVARTVVSYGGGFAPLPGGGILVPSYVDNQVIEYGPRGDPVWKATVSRPTSVVPLPGGNVLVSSLTERRLIELDRTGKEVWQQIMDGRPLKAYRR